jgi:iron complex outermembrane receptor protein
MEDFIFLFPDSVPTLTIRGAFPTFRYKQADARLRGIDGLVEWRMNDIVKLGLFGSLVRGDNLDTGEPLISMPADRIRFTIHCDVGSPLVFTDTYIEFSANSVASQDRVPADADYAPPPDGYTTFDAGFGGELPIGNRALSFDIAVQNILDVSYRDYLSRYRYYTDDPGFNAVVRIRVPFGSRPSP